MVAPASFGEFNSSLKDVGAALADLSPTLRQLTSHQAEIAARQGRMEAEAEYGSIGIAKRRQMVMQKWADFEKTNPEYAGISPYRVIALQEMAAHEYAQSAFGDQLWQRSEEAASAFAEQTPEEIAEQVANGTQPPESTWARSVYQRTTQQIARNWLDQVYAQKRKNVVIKNEQDFQTAFAEQILPELARGPGESFGPEFQQRMRDVSQGVYALTRESGNRIAAEAFETAISSATARKDWSQAREILAAARGYSHNGQATLAQQYGPKFDAMLDEINAKEQQDYPRRIQATTLPVLTEVNSAVAKMLAEPDGVEKLRALQRDPSQVVQLVHGVIAAQGLDQQFAGVAVSQALSTIQEIASNTDQGTPDYTAYADARSLMLDLQIPMPQKMADLTARVQSGGISPQHAEELRRVAENIESTRQFAGGDKLRSTIHGHVASFIGYDPSVLNRQASGEYFEIISTATQEVLDTVIREDVPTITRQLTTEAGPPSEEMIQQAVYPKILERSQMKKAELAEKYASFIQRNNSQFQSKAFLDSPDYRDFSQRSITQIQAVAESYAGILPGGPVDPEFLSSVQQSLVEFNRAARDMVRTELPDLLNQFGPEEAWAQMLNRLDSLTAKSLKQLGPSSSGRDASLPTQGVADHFQRQRVQESPAAQQVPLTGEEAQATQPAGFYSSPLANAQAQIFAAMATADQEKTAQGQSSNESAGKLTAAKQQYWTAAEQLVSRAETPAALSNQKSMAETFAKHAKIATKGGGVSFWVVKPDGIYSGTIHDMKGNPFWSVPSRGRYRPVLSGKPDPIATAEWVNARVGTRGISVDELRAGSTSEGFVIPDAIRLNPSRTRYLMLGQTENDLAAAYNTYKDTGGGPLGDLLSILPGYSAEQVIDAQRSLLRIKVP